MKTKRMLTVAIAILAFIPAVAIAEWVVSPTMSADGRVDGAMANMNWSFGGSKSQEILLAKNTPKSKPKTTAVAKQESSAQQFFSAKELEKLAASLRFPPPVEGRKYLKIGAKPVDPKTFDFLKEDAHILLKDVEVKTIDSAGKTSIGWLRAGEILVTSKGDARVIRIWRCGNPVLSELYMIASNPKTIKKVEEPATALAPAIYEKKPNLFPQETIDKIADKGNDKPTTGWTTGQKWLVGGLVVTTVAAVAYAIGGQQHHSKKTTVITTTTDGGGAGEDPPNGPVPTGPGPEVSN